MNLQVGALITRLGFWGSLLYLKNNGPRNPILIIKAPMQIPCRTLKGTLIIPLKRNPILIIKAPILWALGWAWGFGFWLLRLGAVGLCSLGQRQSNPLAGQYHFGFRV